MAAPKVAQRPLVPLGRGQVVPGGVEMARIEAHPDAIGLPHAVEDRGQVLEAVAQARALAGRDLEQRHHVPPFRAREDGVQAARDRGEAGVLALPHVCAGMQHDVGDAELMAALDLRDQAIPAPGQELGIRTGQVHEVRAVGEHAPDSALRHRFPEPRRLLRAERTGGPLHLVAREDLDGFGPDGLTVAGGVEDTARDGDVGAEMHQVRSVIRRGPTRRKKAPSSSTTLSSSI